MIFLGLGSNMGDKVRNIIAALDHLSFASVQILRRSRLFITPPWGVETQDEFLNIACEVSFKGSPQQLLQILLDTEQLMGRYRYYKWGPRLIDIDILEFHREIHSTESLKLPHPYYPRRPFVLVPLADLEPDWIPTGMDKTVAQILETLPLAGIYPFEDRQYIPVF
ncbi:MAG: 2-amino-4-hydroxy-6-hydroxymethyldihydropteridine diphosphokinase [Bacteroidia bacterium]|nr:2-amino-4-hydroxy-6-hydroxymethyldihydropteridine diphosphokinase [Bacteroidia bacterium]